jgi:sulfate adenylyltransferase
MVRRPVPPEPTQPVGSPETDRLPRVVLGARALDDYDLLSVGGFRPLATFMGEADYHSCLGQMRLANGRLFPIPITLPGGEESRVGSRVALVHPRGDTLATLDVEEVFAIDPWEEARALFNSSDLAHPYIREIVQGPRVRLSGRLTHLKPVPHADFTSLRLSPAEVRGRVAALGRQNVVAFQTRNPLHRSHEELIKRAAHDNDATILLHPVVGLTRPGDIDHFTRVRTYQALLDRYFEPASAVLALLPLAMRMAGPREALLHAIVRKNYGATHFIVGRDHAGPAPDSSGRPFFDPYAAQELVGRHAEEVGVAMVPFREMVYVKEQDRFEEEDRIPPGTRSLSLSGSEVRRHLAEGQPLPAWFTRPETSEILRQAQPARVEQGFCVWFTGLSGAGKSSTAEALRARLMERGRTVTLLDGDEVRVNLSKGLGFSREDRDTNVLRIGFVAAEIVRHRGVAICAAISPFREARDTCRALMGDAFIEVFVDTDLAICEGRDSKGLYARARAGDLKGFTGLDDPYEAPLTPEIRLCDPLRSPAENARIVMDLLRSRGFLA